MQVVTERKERDGVEVTLCPLQHFAFYECFLLRCLNSLQLELNAVLQSKTQTTVQAFLIIHPKNPEVGETSLFYLIHFICCYC